MSLIRTLLLTGENSHDWQRTSAAVAELLSADGRFDVDRTESPDEVLRDADVLAGYDLFFCDYSGEMWAGESRTNFERAVSNGAGLVILHFAINSFAGWKAFEKMCGLRYLRGTSAHGEYKVFEVEIRDHEHPVTSGIANFSQTDELYHTLLNPHDVPIHVLATAFSEEDRGAGMPGSGRDEVVAYTVAYGQGRVFNYLLGHIWPSEVFPGYQGCTDLSYQGESFRSLLIRGCEWAATGEVSR